MLQQFKTPWPIISVVPLNAGIEKKVRTSELTQIKLNTQRFYGVKCTVNFGGELYSHQSRNKEGPTPLIKVEVPAIDYTLI